MKLLRSCVDEEGGLHRDQEEVVVDVMCTICERIKSVRSFVAVGLTRS